MYSSHLLRRLALLPLACCFVLSGCDNTSFAGGNKKASPKPPVEPKPEEPLTENFTAEMVKSSSTVDVVFAIDTSGSMGEETAALNSNLANFLHKFLDHSVDARVTIVGQSLAEAVPGAGSALPPGMTIPTIEIPADLPKDRIAQYKKLVDSFNAIGVLNQFFADQAKPLALRPEGALEVIVISDDNAKGTGNLAADFVKPTAKQFHFNGIIGLVADNPSGVPGSTACSIANVGTEYQTLAAQTQGSIFDLCSTDWGKLFDQLSSQIVSRAGSAFALAKDPDSSKTIKVTLNGTELTADQYKIEGRNLSILIDVPANAAVIVSYFPK